MNVKTHPVYMRAHALSWWPVGGTSTPQKGKVGGGLSVLSMWKETQLP